MKIETLKDIVRFKQIYSRYLKTGDTNQTDTYLLRKLFCDTNGRLNDFLSRIHSFRNPPYEISDGESLIPELSKDEMLKAVSNLDNNGYHVFTHKVPIPTCDQLIEFALSEELTCIDDTGLKKRGKFNPEHPLGVRMQADMETIFKCDAAQQFVADSKLLEIAQRYFRGKAVQDMVAMWWSSPGATADSAAAQYYHFDMPRIKFLKFFLYLTDVDTENGPHCYISGSHRRLPRQLREDRRFTDNEISQLYPPERHIEITGEKGTLCAVDTRGLHKGKPLTNGNRLIFQTEFSTDLFGAKYPRISVGSATHECLNRASIAYPYTYSNFEFK